MPVAATHNANSDRNPDVPAKAPRSRRKRPQGLHNSDEGTKIPYPPYRHRKEYSPRPPYIRREDMQEYEAVKPWIRRLLPQKLDVELTWGNQDENRKRRLISRILEVYPAFADYEDAWPIEWYSNSAFNEIRRRARRNQKRAQARARDKGPQPAPVAERDCPRRPAHKQAHPEREGGQKEPQTTETGAHAPRRQCSQGARPLSIMLGASGTAPSGNTQVIVIQQLGRGEEDVAGFLLGIHESLTGLLDRFRLAGITSMARLGTLAQWGLEEQGQFLQNDVRLNPFERKLVSDALTRLIKDKA